MEKRGAFGGSLLNEINSGVQALRTRSAPDLRRGAERHVKGDNEEVGAQRDAPLWDR